MNVAWHHFCQGVINHSMPLQRVPARECFRLDSNRKVPGAVASAWMTSVLGAVIPHRDSRRGECGFQSGLDAGEPGFGHVARVRDAIQKPCTMTNTNVSPSIP